MARIPRAVSTRFFQMDSGAKNWLRKTAMKNYWRVAAWISLDDLIQDGELCWMLVRRHYLEAELPHLMALFKRTYTNHLHDLANNRTLQSVEIPFVVADISNLEQLEGGPCPFAELLGLVTEAPARVNRLLTSLLTDPSPLRVAYHREGYVIETTNERLCGVAGLDPVAVDLHTAVRSTLTCN